MLVQLFVLSTLTAQSFYLLASVVKLYLVNNGRGRSPRLKNQSNSLIHFLVKSVFLPQFSFRDQKWAPECVEVSLDRYIILVFDLELNCVLRRFHRKFIVFTVLKEVTASAKRSKLLLLIPSIPFLTFCSELYFIRVFFKFKAKFLGKS